MSDPQAGPTEADMTADDSVQHDAEFFRRLELALRELFAKAQESHELHFAMALTPEVRDAQDSGWSTADDAIAAHAQYLEILEKLPRGPGRVRVALAFYNHCAESSGLYEVMKKMLLTIEGKGNNIWPFMKLVESHKATGARIAPNANKIMQDMIGHAQELGLMELAEVIRDAFDGDVRNAVAHADYIIWHDGLRLRRRNGGSPRNIPWDEVDIILHRGINLFAMLNDKRAEFIESYRTPKTITAQLHDEPIGPWTIYCIDGGFGIASGTEIPKRSPRTV